MYLFVEPMNLTTVSISSPRLPCFGRRIFGFTTPLLSCTRPVRAYKDTFPYFGRSPRRLMSERQRPTYDTDAGKPDALRSGASFFLPRRGCFFRNPPSLASSSAGIRRTLRFFGAVLLLSSP